MNNDLDVTRDVKNTKGLKLKIDSNIGYIINGVVLLIGIYFRLKGNVTYSVALGDSGSIVVSLLKGFSLTSGRSLIYLSLYGLLLTLVSKKDSLKEFYNYYMIAVIFLTIGSLVYFVV